MSVKALHPDTVLSQPGFDELRDNVHGLVVRIRDNCDRGLNVTFPAAWRYEKVDESYGGFLMSPVNAGLEPGRMPHWFYEVTESDNLRAFKTNNPHHHPGIKEWLLVLYDEVISVIGIGEPVISERTDDIRSFHGD